MEPTEVAASYDTIAHRWLTEPPATNGLQAHEHALKFRLPNQGQAQGGGALALDVGAGCNPRLRQLLQKHGYQVEALDLSAQMIALAREREPSVTFHHADICTWTPPHAYDFITAWDSIWHVPLDRSAAVLQKLCGALTPGGIFIWTTGGLDAPEEKRDASMGPPMYYSVLGLPGLLQHIAAAGCICRHLEYDQLPEKHVFLIAQKA